MNRRSVLIAGPMVLGSIAQAAKSAIAQPLPATGKHLGEHALGSAFGDWLGTIREVTYPPGGSREAHQHPGPTLGYVVSGRIRWAIDGNAPSVLEAGMSFFEPMGSVHSTAANASNTEPARLVVVVLSKPGDELSKPVGKPLA